jgi:hypothetical protein
LTFSTVRDSKPSPCAASREAMLRVGVQGNHAPAYLAQLRGQTTCDCGLANASFTTGNRNNRHIPYYKAGRASFWLERFC